MNPSDPDYLYKVFPEDPLMGAAPVYIEAVYDMALYKELYDTIYAMMTGNTDTAKTADPDTGFVEEYVLPYGIKGLGPIPEGCDIEDEPESGETSGDTKERIPCAYVPDSDTETKEFRYWNFISPYRCAVTPWIVSEVKAASTETIDVKKLFKVYTISDGNAANYQVKISIQRIRPVEGLFDLVVRDFYDTDNSQLVLEKFTNCSMTEGESNFVGLKVGTIDGTYPNRRIIESCGSENGKFDLPLLDQNFKKFKSPKVRTFIADFRLNNPFDLSDENRDMYAKYLKRTAKNRDKEKEDKTFEIKGKTLKSYKGIDTLSVVRVPEGISKLGMGAFGKDDNTITEIILPEGLTTIDRDSYGNRVFSG